MNKRYIFFLLTVFLLLISFESNAQLSSDGILDKVIEEFSTKASNWQTSVKSAADYIFWTLVLISIVWTFGMLSLKQADSSEFFGELIKFVIFVGFYYWLLENSPAIGKAIIDGLVKLGSNASGSEAIYPSKIVDIGFLIFKRVIESISVSKPIDAAASLLMSIVILVVLTVIAVNMMLIAISSWLLLYAGIFYLGFGGSKWTSDIAINYYKTVLGIGIQLYSMVLIVGIGYDIINSSFNKLSSEASYQELAVMLVACIALLMLVSKIPTMLAGVITGSAVSGSGVGSFTAGAAVGAAMAAASTSTAMISNTLANAGGVADTLKAAFEKGDSDTSQDTSGAGTPFISDDAINSLTSTSSADSGTGGGSGGGAGTEPTSGGSASSSEAEGDSNGSNTAGNSTSEGSQASGSSDKSSKESSGSSISSALSSASKATGHAAKSIVDAALSTAKTAARDRIAETPGGKVANAIREARENNKAIDEVDSAKLRNK